MHFELLNEVFQLFYLKDVGMPEVGRDKTGLLLIFPKYKESIAENLSQVSCSEYVEIGRDLSIG
jgi:hypothetical protein